MHFEIPSNEALINIRLQLITYVQACLCPITVLSEREFVVKLSDKEGTTISTVQNSLEFPSWLTSRMQSNSGFRCARIRVKSFR